MVVGCPQCYLMYTRENLPKEIGVAAQNCYKVSFIFVEYYEFFILFMI